MTAISFETRLRFFDLMIELMVETINADEGSIALWQEHFSGFKQWLFGPEFPYLDKGTEL